MDRRDLLSSLGVLGTGVAVGASGRKLHDSNTQEESKYVSNFQDVVNAVVPVWNSEAKRQWLRIPQGESVGKHLISNGNLSYFGATYESNADARDGDPVWRHKFALTGNWYSIDEGVAVDEEPTEWSCEPTLQPVANREFNMGHREGAKSIMKVTPNSSSSLSLSPLYGQNTLGIIGPENFTSFLDTSLEKAEMAESKLAEEIVNSGVNPENIDVETALANYGGEVASERGEALSTTNFGDVISLGLGVAALSTTTSAFTMAGLAYVAGTIILDYISSPPPNRFDPSEVSFSFRPTEKGPGQAHFLVFDVLVEPNTGGSVTVQSTFEFGDGYGLVDSYFWGIDIEPLPDPTLIEQSCVNSDTLSKNGASIPDTSGYRNDWTCNYEDEDPITTVLQSHMAVEGSSGPHPEIIEPRPDDKFIVGEPIKLRTDESENVIDSRWFIQHSDDGWCRVSRFSRTLESHTPSTGGYMTVALVQRNAAGVSGVDTVEIWVDEYPKLTSLDLDYTVPVGETTTISAAVEAESDVTFAWDVGPVDSSASDHRASDGTKRNVDENDGGVEEYEDEYSYVPTVTGKHQVSLQATDVDNNTVQAKDYFTVTSQPEGPEIIEFEIGCYTVPVDESVTIAATVESVTEPDWSIDVSLSDTVDSSARSSETKFVGDGIYEKEWQYTPSEAGKYDVELAVEDGNGNTDSVSDFFEAKDTLYKPNIKELNITPYDPDVGESVDISAAVESGSEVNFFWDVGPSDTIESKAVNPTSTESCTDTYQDEQEYVPSQPGKYDVTLTVTNQLNQQDEAYDFFNANEDDDGGGDQPEPPEVSISGPDSLLPGDTATYTADVAAGSDLSFNWDGDVSGSGSSITTSWDDQGDKYIEVAAENDVGEDLATKTVDVSWN
ncbi:PKD domain-containing protein [Halovivax limisalsi]|uniref:PKD domain-containing protein n=1 Tax=Halovivax limisalsi TaxID=1453760 RepID=UPI001FFDA7CF|nr:PKD domain-containing protein [Halovivax limisalsi]